MHPSQWESGVLYGRVWENREKMSCWGMSRTPWVEWSNPISPSPLCLHLSVHPHSSSCLQLIDRAHHPTVVTRSALRSRPVIHVASPSAASCVVL